MKRILIAFCLLITLVTAVFYAKALGDRRTKEQIAWAMTRGDLAKAPETLRRFGCAGCHTIPGVDGADGKVGPSLDNLRQRVYIAGVVKNSPDNFVAWIVAPRAFSPRSAMPETGITESEARDVAAYLYAR